MSYQANDQETCLFCLGEEEPTQPLQANKKCRCKYSYHDACYARYDRKEICPLCKRHEGQPYSPSPSAPPAVPPHHVTLTITLPRETTAIYTHLAQYTAPPSRHPTRKLTPLHVFYICIALLICSIIAFGIIMIFG